MGRTNWDGTCHIVHFDNNSDNVDMHSHGLKEEIGTELQYVLNLMNKKYFEERCQLFYMIADEVLMHRLKIADGDVFLLKAWKGCKFKFYKTKDCDGEDIYRVIECDMHGRFPDNPNCDSFFKTQYVDLYSK